MSVKPVRTNASRALRSAPGVDPLFEIAPQDEADAMLRAAFDRWFEEALRAPGPGLRRTLARADNDREETPSGSLFNAALDLSQWRDFPAQWGQPPFDREAELETLFAEMSEIGDLADLGRPGAWLYESLAKIRLVAREAVRLEKIRGRDLDAREAALMKLLRGSRITGTGRASARTLAIIRDLR